MRSTIASRWPRISTGSSYRRYSGANASGWIQSSEPTQTRASIDPVRRHAEAAGRDPGALGFQAMLAPPPNDRGGKTFYQEHDRVVRRAEEVRDLGFGWLAINATAIFQSGARHIDAMVEQLDTLHRLLRGAVG